MIESEQELQVTQERIAYFQRLLGGLRQAAAPGEFEMVSGGYRLEIERMQAEVMDYYLRPITVEVAMSH